MMKKLSVLIAGRSKAGLEGIVSALKGQPDLDVQVRRAENGHSDPLHGITSMPTILILDLSPLWEEELKALTARSERPLLVAVGPEGDTGMMRMAMQAGARDFFTHPVHADELIASLRQVAQESSVRETKKKGSLIAVMNAKGGSGASFITANTGHAMAVHQKQRVAVLDMDLQFGTLPLYFDLTPRESLLDALNAVDQLDPVALQGYMAKHGSGLHLLTAMSDMVPLPWEVSTRNLGRLLDVAVHSYDHVLVDLPRQIDPLTSAVLEQADKVLIVMQQGITHIRDARRLLRILTSELAVSKDCIHVILNRHDDKSAVSVADITDALELDTVVLVPNDFRRVSEAINLGVPLLDSARKTPITRAIVHLAGKLDNEPRAVRKGFLRNPISYFLGS